MKIKRVKGFFAFGFGVDQMMLQYKGRVLCYHLKIYIGQYVLMFDIWTKARKDYLKQFDLPLQPAQDES